MGRARAIRRATSMGCIYLARIVPVACAQVLSGLLQIPVSTSTATTNSTTTQPTMEVRNVFRSTWYRICNNIIHKGLTLTNILHKGALAAVG